MTKCQLCIERHFCKEYSDYDKKCDEFKKDEIHLKQIEKIDKCKNCEKGFYTGENKFFCTYFMEETEVEKRCDNHKKLIWEE